MTTPNLTLTRQPLGTASSQIRCAVGNGYGSVGTKVRCYVSGNTTTIGSGLTYISDSTNGDRFVVNETGIYSIYRSDKTSTSGPNYGISKNASSNTAAIYALTATEVLAIQEQFNSGINTSLCVSVRLTAGDIIRAHDAPVGTPTVGTVEVQFIITQIVAL